jgi:hypothetical protein
MNECKGQSVINKMKGLFDARKKKRKYLYQILIYFLPSTTTKVY